jgi:hypothetical protein
MKQLVLLITLLFTCPVFGQEDDERTKIVESRIEFIGESIEDSNIDFTTFLEDLYQFYDNPINLNQTNFDELSRLHLLSDSQILAILNYKKKYGKFLSVYEINAVPGLGLEEVDLIVPFIRVGEARTYKMNWKNALKYGKSEVFLRYQRDLQKREGYIQKPDSILELSPNKQYQGSPDKIYTRYRYTYKDKISWGVTGEKDAGEQFFRGAQKQGFDFYSGHLMIANQGVIKKVVVGDFQANFGQGLTMWSGFNMGKTPNALNVKRYASGLKPYTSVNEANFLRGGGITFEKKQFDFTAFASYKRIDANLNVGDTLFGDGNEGITSFQQSGFHRTIGEIEDKNAVKQSVFGAATHITNDNLKIGLVGVLTNYNVPLQASSQAYSKFNFQGTSNFSLGGNYMYFKNKISLFGEMSLSKNNSIAVLNGFTWHADPRLDLVILHRYLDKNNQSIYSAPFGGSTSNDNGLYFGAKAKITKHLNISAYYDQFTSGWLKWLTDGPSVGREVLVQADYKINYSSSFYIRFKNKITQRDSKDDVVGVDKQVFLNKTNVRLHYSQRINSQLSLRSRVEWVNFLYDTDKSNGILLYQDLVYSFKKIPLKLSARYAIFDTDNYDTRLYAYENDLLYVFSIPSYFYKGMRTYLMLKYDFGENIDFWARWGLFSYANEDEISSGLETIYGSKKSDIKLQLKIRF